MSLKKKQMKVGQNIFDQAKPTQTNLVTPKTFDSRIIVLPIQGRRVCEIYVRRGVLQLFNSQSRGKCTHGNSVDGCMVGISVDGSSVGANVGS